MTCLRTEFPRLIEAPRWWPVGARSVLGYLGTDEPMRGPDMQPSAVPRHGRAAALQPLRVAVVEDEAIIALQIEEILSEMGAEVVGMCMSADEAIRLAERAQPDFFTMDISLRGQRDGISAAVEIFQRFGIRSVFISAYGDAEAVERAESANPLGWIRKPIDDEDLDALLRRLRPDGSGS